MNYAKTKKDVLIDMLKKAQKNETRLAAKLRKQEIESAEQQAKICTAISEATVYEAQIADLEAQLAEKAVLAGINKRLLKLVYTENTKRIGAEQSCEIYEAKITDLEAQLAAEKAGGKVDGVFTVGDRVVTHGTGYDDLDGLELTVKSTGSSTYYQDGVVSFIELDEHGCNYKFEPKYLRHAPTCPECAAKQKRVDELRENLNDAHCQLIDEQNKVASYIDYKAGVEAELCDKEQRCAKYSKKVDSQSALIADMDTALTRKNYIILELSDQVAALEMGN